MTKDEMLELIKKMEEEYDTVIRLAREIISRLEAIKPQIERVREWLTDRMII